MFQKMIQILLASFILSGAAVAHGGHPHILGTVKAVEGDHMTIQTNEGKKVVIMINDQTKFFRKNAKASREDLKVGARVAVEAESNPEMQDMLTAKKIQFGAAAERSKNQTVPSSKPPSTQHKY